MAPLTVGFDLDMTLIDARPGMVRAFDLLAAETGIPLDGERFAANLGPPLDHEFRRYGVDEATVADLVVRFRAMYPEVVIPTTVPLPGAVEALAAVRAAGWRTVIVTGKQGANAALHLKALNWEVDHLAGLAWSTDKAVVLRQQGAVAYVGDHTGDMAGARAADALAVAVPTGPCSADELLAAGADVVLGDLTEFPAWLAGAAPALAKLAQQRDEPEPEAERHQHAT